MSLFVVICKVTVVNATVLFEFGGGATDFFFILLEMNVRETIIFFSFVGLRVEVMADYCTLKCFVLSVSGD